MTHRMRMARKRLMVARERDRRAQRVAIEVTLSEVLLIHSNLRAMLTAWGRLERRGATLRAIERRKDRIA